MAVYWGYLEIEAHANGGSKDHDRYGQALLGIKTARLGTMQVTHIIEAAQGQEPVRIRHFGWDAKCADMCPHEGAAYGVLRYFGLNLVTPERVGTVKHIGTWRIGPSVQLTICGLFTGFPVGQGRYPAERVKALGR